MRILLVSTSMGMGGADKQILTAAQQLRGEGHELMIVSLTELGPMGHQARDLGIPTESLEMPRGIAHPRGLLRLIRLVRRWKPDLIHSHMVHANLMVRLVRLVAPVPALVQTIHSIQGGGPHLMAGYRLTNRLADHMTVVSQAAADRYIRERIVPESMVRVVPNGIDVELFESVPSSTRESLRRELGLGREFVWLAVGRFETPKDYPTMLRGFAQVRQQRPDSVLLLVGRGSLQAETEALARELGLAGSVRFLGVRDDIPEIMTAADGYVMSSAWEGMPMVLLEAAAAALPIVTTDVGGNGQLVQHEENGFLIPPESPEDLGEAMLRLMRLPESERRAMGVRGRELVRSRYSLSRTVELWEEVYRDVLSRKGLDIRPGGSRRIAEPLSTGVISGDGSGGQR
jgi:glycosyltransferase involved in cell wall biosynthesis